MLLLIQYEESHLHQSTCSLSASGGRQCPRRQYACSFLIYSAQKKQTFIQQVYFNVSKTYIQTMIQCCTWTPFKKKKFHGPSNMPVPTLHSSASIQHQTGREGGWRVPFEVYGASSMSAMVWMTSAPSLMCIYSIRLNYTGSSNTPSARG